MVRRKWPWKGVKWPSSNYDGRKDFTRLLLSVQFVVSSDRQVFRVPKRVQVPQYGMPIINYRTLYHTGTGKDTCTR